MVTELFNPLSYFKIVVCSLLRAYNTIRCRRCQLVRFNRLSKYLPFHLNDLKWGAICLSGKFPPYKRRKDRFLGCEGILVNLTYLPQLMTHFVWCMLGTLYSVPNVRGRNGMKRRNLKQRINYVPFLSDCFVHQWNIGSGGPASSARWSTRWWKQFHNYTNNRQVKGSTGISASSI